MNPKITKNIKELLQKPNNIVVMGHKNPDGDAIGSCLALANYLRQKKQKVSVVMPNDFPEFLKWIPEAHNISIYSKKPSHTRQLILEADVIFTLDFNAFARAGDLEEVLEKAANKTKENKPTFVMIDHHQQPDDYASIQYSDVRVCSTSQMVYHTIDSLDDLKCINNKIATQLYTGIMTDTGSFKYPSTTATTHKVIAKLIECGANNAQIHQNVYDTNSEDRLKLLGVALNNLKVLSEYRTAFITLSQEELDLHHFKKGDTEGFVNYALSIKNIIFAAIFIESKQENIIKISLRSKGLFSVNEFSRLHFKGGGHTNAAGGKSTLSLEETSNKFINILPSYKEKLNHEI